LARLSQAQSSLRRWVGLRRPLPGRIVKLALWLATALVAAAIAFPYIAPMLLGT